MLCSVHHNREACRVYVFVAGTRGMCRSIALVFRSPSEGSVRRRGGSACFTDAQYFWPVLSTFRTDRWRGLGFYVGAALEAIDVFCMKRYSLFSYLFNFTKMYIKSSVLAFKAYLLMCLQVLFSYYCLSLLNVQLNYLRKTK